MLAVLKRAAGFSPVPDFTADLESDLSTIDLGPQPTMVERASSAVANLLTDARATKARLLSEIAERQELLRQADVILETFGPCVGRLKQDDDYNPEDDARDSYTAAIEAKRKRGDRQYLKSVKAEVAP